jgi:2-keto-4-pentenoate hydratase/2-oxohepta-3-ene-1,7-dioic acid hydratase in catechol pathway
MRICRFRAATGQPTYGAVENHIVHELTGDVFDADSRALGVEVGALASVSLLAPVAPTKVICAGRNYRSLLKEQGRELPAEPFLFLKASTAVVGPGAPVLYPTDVTDVAHEGELAVVIGTESRGLTRDTAMQAVLGYTAANDVTVRDWQASNHQWWRAKSADTHCPLGPWVVTDLPDPHHTRVRTYVNDELRQDGNTSDLVFDIPDLLVHITAHMTLLPGDVLLTGTAAGIRSVSPGDVMRVEIDNVGCLENEVQPAHTASIAVGA